MNNSKRSPSGLSKEDRQLDMMTLLWKNWPAPDQTHIKYLIYMLLKTRRCTALTLSYVHDI